MIPRSSIAVDLDRVAGRCRRVLDREAIRCIVGFIESSAAEGGGFVDRGGRGDVYYTLFGLASLRALGRPVRTPVVADYLEQQDITGLDLVHLAALVQARRILRPLGLPRRFRREVGEALSRFQTLDGGFAEQVGCEQATPYGNYLAVLVTEVVGLDLPATNRFAPLAERLLRQGCTGLEEGRTGLPTLAAAILVAHKLGCLGPLSPIVAMLRRLRRTNSGFAACRGAPLPDLLSTAVAAFTLSRLGEPCRGKDAAEIAAFVQECWHETGGFCSGSHDEAPDCEYTLYGLLALGALEP